MSAGAPPADRAPPPAVGERVLVEGTGPWWRGHVYVATVADVRDGPDGGTVKLRYLDGGHKVCARDSWRGVRVKQRGVKSAKVVVT